MLELKLWCFNCKIIYYNTVHVVGVVLCKYSDVSARCFMPVCS